MEYLTFLLKEIVVPGENNFRRKQTVMAQWVTGVPAFFFILFVTVLCKKSIDEDKPKWAKKDIRDYTDADMERLLDQWDVSKLLF